MVKIEKNTTRCVIAEKACFMMIPEQFPTTRITLLDRLRGEGADGRAWREFEATYRELLLRYCRKRGLQPADAEDVVQDIFISLARSLPGFRYDETKGRFRYYLLRCVRNGIFRANNRRDRLNKALYNHGADTSLDAMTENISAEERDAWNAEWVAHHYRLAMIRLRTEEDPQTIRIIERSMDGATPPQIAAELGLSLAAVYKIRERARTRLHTFVMKQLQEEDGSP